MNRSLHFHAKAKRARPEAALQRAICEHLRLVGTPGMIYFSLPNEGKRSPQAGQELKRMGLRPGAADLCIVIGGRAHFLELKSASGKQSKDQVTFAADCAIAGCPYELVNSIDHALRLLTAWGAIRMAKRAA